MGSATVCKSHRLTCGSETLPGDQATLNLLHYPKDFQLEHHEGKNYEECVVTGKDSGS